MAIGFVFGIFAIGLLPFLFIYSLTEVYGITDLYEWMGVSPLIIFAGRKKKEDPGDEPTHTDM
jgi:hypothetical protein